jgi:hypothetical protein
MEYGGPGQKRGGFTNSSRNLKKSQTVILDEYFIEIISSNKMSTTSINIMIINH